ncbi:MAG TPA: PrgI family protein [Candidatus Paceibacterota bacterium]|nr:PrgI family protein [Candidatus Paceibacterota bacterium]
MEYQVPQFIEVEDRVVGPLTIKQFIYLAGGAGLCAIFLFYLPLLFALLFAIPAGGLAVALAFYRVNGKPFIDVMESAFGYYTGAKLFLWKHEDAPAKSSAAALASESPAPLSKAAPRLSRGKLSELAWSLDVQSGGQSSRE